MRRYGELESASKTMEEIESVLCGNDAFQFWLFQKRWPELAGKTLAEESYIGRAEGSVLYIYATNSVWMQELLIYKEKLLEKIRDDAYGKRFSELRVVMMTGKPRETEFSPAEELRKKYKKNQEIRLLPLETREKEWIREWTASHVEKEALRPVFSQMMEGALGRRKAELAEGWHPCLHCGNLCPPKENLCPSCRLRKEKQVKNKIVLLLKEKPELLYEETVRLISCSYAEFAEARDILIHRYKENYYRGYGSEEETRRLLSLLTHKPFENITKEEAEKALSSLPRKKW